MNKNKDYLITEKPSRALFAFALPMIIGNLFQQLYSFVDSMVVGKESEIRRLPQLETQAPFIF